MRRYPGSPNHEDLLREAGESVLFRFLNKSVNNVSYGVLLEYLQNGERDAARNAVVAAVYEAMRLKMGGFGPQGEDSDEHVIEALWNAIEPRRHRFHDVAGLQDAMRRATGDSLVELYQSDSLASDRVDLLHQLFDHLQKYDERSERNVRAVRIEAGLSAVIEATFSDRFWSEPTYGWAIRPELHFAFADVLHDFLVAEGVVRDLEAEAEGVVRDLEETVERDTPSNEGGPYWNRLTTVTKRWLSQGDGRQRDWRGDFALDWSRIPNFRLVTTVRDRINDFIEFNLRLSPDESLGALGAGANGVPGRP